MPADPIVAQFEATLRGRKDELEREHNETRTLLTELEDKLASVNSTWNQLYGKSQETPPPPEPKSSESQHEAAHEPESDLNPVTAKAVTANKRNHQKRVKAAVVKLREILPQDGEWHDLRPIKEALAEATSKRVAAQVLREQPIERHPGGWASTWQIRWKTDVRVRPKGGNVSEAEIRDFILDTPEGFTRAELAEYFGRTQSWTQKVLEPFQQKGVISIEKRGSKLPDLIKYVPPPSTITPAANGNGKTDAGRSGGGTGVAGTGKSRDLPKNKELAQLVRTAKSQGYIVTHMKGGHFAVSNGNASKRVVVSGTPSDRYAAANAKRDLVKIGVQF